MDLAKRVSLPVFQKVFDESECLNESVDTLAHHSRLYTHTLTLVEPLPHAPRVFDESESWMREDITQSTLSMSDSSTRKRIQQW